MTGPRDPQLDTKLDRLLTGGAPSVQEKEQLFDAVFDQVGRERAAADDALTTTGRASKLWLKLLPLGAVLTGAAVFLLLPTTGGPVTGETEPGGEIGPGELTARGGEPTAAGAVRVSCGDKVVSGADQAGQALVCRPGQPLKVQLVDMREGGAAKASPADPTWVVAALLLPPETLLWFSPDDDGGAWTSSVGERTARAFDLPPDLNAGEGALFVWRFTKETARADVRAYLEKEAARQPKDPPTNVALSGGVAPVRVPVMIMRATSP